MLELSYLRLTPSFHLDFPLACFVARMGEWHKPMVSSTSAGRLAEAVKARLPLRPARCAGLFSDRINCCRSMLGRVQMAMVVAAELSRRRREVSTMSASVRNNPAAVIGSCLACIKFRIRPHQASLLTHSRPEFIVGRLGVLLARAECHISDRPLLPVPRARLTVRRSWS